jgi:osmotically-inducible protein OsmY
MTRRIRSALTDNDQLSSSAKNIKVITANGRVTLRGPVNSEQEREQIANLVKQMGVTTVDNQLEVKTSNQ